jgi:hypothetical protein
MSATFTNQDIRNMDKRPMVFLSLAPTTSDSYRTAQPAAAERPAARRTSSLSSTGSTQPLRFLKLGPVHNGEDLDEAVE